MLSEAARLEPVSVFENAVARPPPGRNDFKDEAGLSKQPL